MSTILVAGVAVLDFVFHMEEFPRRAEKYRADAAVISGGGNAANAAVAIARLNGQAHLASRLGSDEIADMILSGLARESVHTGLVQQYAERRSSFSSIYIDGHGERQIMNFRDTDLPWHANWIADNYPTNMTAALADTRWPDGALAAMELARQQGVPGIMDAEAPVLEAEAAIQAASHVAFSAQGAVDFTGLDNIDQAALKADQLLPGRVLITDGEHGVVLADGGRTQRIHRLDVEGGKTLGSPPISQHHPVFSIGNQHTAG